MRSGRDEHGEWLRPATPEDLDSLTDAEIEAAIAGDPDAGPHRTEANWDSALARETELDSYGVARRHRRLGMVQIVFADRNQIPLRTLRTWKQGLTEPDRAARVLLAVRAAEHAREPEFRASGLADAA